MRPAAATAALGLVLVLTAATFDAEPLYVPGAAFILLAALSVAWVVAASRGVRIARTVSARRVVEEQPVQIVIRVRSGSLALPAGLVEDPLLPSPAPIAAGRRAATVQIDARFARRGRKRLVEPSVIVRDPFGLATRVVQGGGEAEVLVLPRVERVVTPPGQGDGTGLAARRGRPGGGAGRGPSCPRAASAPPRRRDGARAGAGPPAAGARPWRPRSTSTACARTGPARPPRGCTGPRSRAPASSSSAGCGRTR